MPSLSPRLAGHLALVLANLVFGLFPVFGRLAMEPERGWEPFSLAAWRIGVGAGAFTLLAFAARKPLRPERRDWVPIVVLALAGIVANQVLYLAGLSRTSAAGAGLMMCTIPAFTLAGAVLVKQERFSPLRAAGIVVTVAGLYPLLTSGGDFEMAASGNALIAVNCLCYSMFLVGVKPMRTRHSAVTIMAWVYLASLPALPFLAAGKSLMPVESTPEMWGALAYVVLGPTVIAYLLGAFALGKVRASTTAFYILAQPVISAVGGAVVLGEGLPDEALLAALGLIPGLILVTRPQPRERDANA